MHWDSNKKPAHTIGMRGFFPEWRVGKGGERVGVFSRLGRGAIVHQRL